MISSLGSMPNDRPDQARAFQGPVTVATEVRAGATTFMVMAYIIFVNPLILGFAGVPGLEGKGLPFAPTLTVTSACSRSPWACSPATRSRWRPAWG